MLSAQLRSLMHCDRVLSRQVRAVSWRWASSSPDASDSTKPLAPSASSPSNAAGALDENAKQELQRAALQKGLPVHESGFQEGVLKRLSSRGGSPTDRLLRARSALEAAREYKLRKEDKSS